MARNYEWSNGVKAVLRHAAAVTALAALTGAATAAPINPNPGTWGNDTGAIALGHGAASFSAEQSSLAPAVPMFFGFYFDGNTPSSTGADGKSNGAVVFDPGDLVGDKAIINFAGGAVVDLKDFSVVNFTISPPGTGNIGFFIVLQFPGQSGFTTLYTDPALNGGFDVASMFPALTDPSTFLIAFEVPSGTGGFIDAYSVVITGLHPIPEPTTWALIGLGLLLLVQFAGVARARRQIPG